MKLKSIKCPKCSTLITDPNEIDFVLYNNCCFTCDHHTVWDDMTQEDIDASWDYSLFNGFNSGFNIHREELEENE